MRINQKESEIANILRLQIKLLWASGLLSCGIIVKHAVLETGRLVQEELLVEFCRLSAAKKLHIFEVLKLSYICRTINLLLISLDNPGVNIYIICVLIFVYADR